jgi:UDP-glucuronate decarboxylase
VNKPEITMKDLAKKIQYLIPKKVKIRFKNYPKKYPQTEPLRRCPDISRLVKEFKFKQFTKIEDSIMNFYKWSQRYY